MTLEPSIAPAHVLRAGEQEGEFDPLSDLFFTLAAILLLILVALLPGVVSPGSRGSRHAAGRPLADFTFERAGHRVMPFLALRSGLLRASPPKLVALDTIASDPELARELRRMAQAGETPVLLVAPDGLEASFEFDALAGSLGLASFDQLRLSGDCRLPSTAAVLECSPVGGAKDR